MFSSWLPWPLGPASLSVLGVFQNFLVSLSLSVGVPCPDLGIFSPPLPLTSPLGEASACTPSRITCIVKTPNVSPWFHLPKVGSMDPISAEFTPQH